MSESATMECARRVKPFFIGRIYMLTNMVDNENYIGSTMQTLCERLKGHNNDSKRYDHTKLYLHFNKIGRENWLIKELRLCIVSSESDLKKIEQWYKVQLQPTLNTRSASGQIQKKQYKKQYGIDNAERLKQYRIDNTEHKRQYQIDNADKIRERMKQYYIDNEDKIREQKKQYHINNADKIRDKKKQYRIDNADKIRDKKKQYRLKKKLEKSQ